MAWVTKIVADEQVEYRLKKQAGCSVVAADGKETVVLDDAVDPAVAYRLRSEGGAELVWMGSGLAALGLTEGAVLDEDGKAAARLIMSGCDPRTGARLIKGHTSMRAHEKAELTTARVVEAIVRAAEEQGVEPAELFDGKPKQRRVFEAQQRKVAKGGERERMQVTTLHKLVRAAGLALDDIYGAEELAVAWENKDLRVDSRQRGWDVVLDLPKSDSVLQGLLPQLSEREYRDLIHQAKDDTFRLLEKWAGYAVGSENGEPVRIATGGLMAWSVEHQSSRPVKAGEPGDPHLHVHVTLANMALCEDGEWRSIANSGLDLYRHASALDAVFKARVRALTYEHFGVRRERNERTGAWEVRGIPEQVRDGFSRRAALVEAKAGDGATLMEKKAISAETKRAKLDADATTMRTSWRTRAGQMVGDVDAMVAAAAPGAPGPDGGAGVDGPGTGPRIPPPADIAAVVFDPKTGLTANDKMFTRAQLLAAVANSLEFGLGADPMNLERLCDEVLAVEGYAIHVPPLGTTVMSSNARYTTLDILEAEAMVRQEALDRFASRSVQLPEDQARLALDIFETAAGFELSEEQRTAVTRILTAGHGIDALVGVAGAGKSTLMEACRIGWDATGTTYAGATLAAVAAKNLTDASGIPARTIAAWLLEIESGNGLRGVDVLVVDEATMVDDRAAAVLMAEAARTGTKVVAIGDHLQLQAVGPGGWFRETHRIVHGLTLTENRRQEDAAERAALEVWRTGDHERALKMLADGGRVHAAETAEEARSQILMAWDELRLQEWGDPHDLIANMVVLAAKNSDVDALNLGAQQIRRSAGELGDEYTYAMEGGDSLTLAVGDIVRVRENDYRSRRGAGPDLLNGYRAVVTAARPDRSVEITWRVKDAAAEEGFRYESGWVKADKVASGALSLGYAMTVAASQGLTTNTSLLYGHGANAFATYPGITRARVQNHIWLPLAVLEDEQTRVRLGEARSETERLERSIDAFARFLRQSRPDSMVSDLLHEPPAPAPLPKQRDLAAEEAQAEADRRLRQSRMAAAARAKSTTIRRPSPVGHAQDEAHREEPRLTDEHMEKLRQFKEQHEEREVEPWTSRPYGKLTDAELDRTIARKLRHARLQDKEADQVEKRLQDLVERISPTEEGESTYGQRWAAEAGKLLDDAEKLLSTVHTELDTAHTQKSTAEQRTDWLADLRAADDKSWLTLRLAGTSRKEQKQLTNQYTAERAQAWQEASRASVAARETLKEAWELLRDSKFATPLQASKPVPGDVEAVAEAFTQMRETASRHGHTIDVNNAQRVAHLEKEVATQRGNAQTWRGDAADITTEKAQRTTIAARFPALHESETAGRIERERNAQAAEKTRRDTAAAATTTAHYEPPTQSRGGPRMGR
ncbi:AAA family ATPase (plasmid) [Streptomyces sp. NBC_01102]|uniref:MobF family relaxase n=1 Tax=Streptomyces sp. NBC_01102 TaxID=2903749 RepID=UPI002F915446|nr:AAA family ATPase [Streptomyces sp. NBC_01102]